MSWKDQVPCVGDARAQGPVNFSAPRAEKPSILEMLSQVESIAVGVNVRSQRLANLLSEEIPEKAEQMRSTSTVSDRVDSLRTLLDQVTDSLTRALIALEG